MLSNTTQAVEKLYNDMCSSDDEFNDLKLFKESQRCCYIIIYITVIG